MRICIAMRESPGGFYRLRHCRRLLALWLPCAMVAPGLGPGSFAFLTLGGTRRRKSEGQAGAWSRRRLAGAFGAVLSGGAPAEALVGSTPSPDLEAKVRLKGGSIADFFTTDSGLRYIDLLEGKGTECCKVGTGVVLDWSLRRANGYFVDASFGFDQSRGIDERFGVGETPELRFVPVSSDSSSAGTVVKGLQEGVLGMRVGGTRRIIVPPELAYSRYGQEELSPMPQDWGRKRQIERFKNQPFIFEIRLKSLRG
mmetsp:Transcript_49723/g.91793  ORF Transcript_49723/g.91793 Transcript_49723/m.91793 type:complete len:255 (+) Transcript_49723:22-786(+)